MNESNYSYVPEEDRRAAAAKLLEPCRGVSAAMQVGLALGSPVLDARAVHRLGEIIASSADDLRESYERGYDAGFADGSENRPQGRAAAPSVSEVSMEGDGFRCGSCGATWPYVRSAPGAALEIGLFCPMCASRLVVSSDKAEKALAAEERENANY